MSKINKFNGSINKPFVPEKKQDDKKARIVAIVLLLILVFCCFGSVLAIGLTVKDCTTASAEEVVSEQVPVPEGYPNLFAGNFNPSNVKELSTCTYTNLNSFSFRSWAGSDYYFCIFTLYPVQLAQSFYTMYSSYSSSVTLVGFECGLFSEYYGYWGSGLSTRSLTSVSNPDPSPFSLVFKKIDPNAVFPENFTCTFSVGLWEGNFSNSDFSSSVYYQAGLLQGQTDGYKLGYNEGYSKGQEDTVMNFDPNSLFYPFDYNNLSALYSITSSGSTSSSKIGFTSDNNTLSFARGTLSFPTNNELVTGKSIIVGFADFVPLYASSFKVLNVSFLSDLLTRYPENEGYAIDFLLHFYTSPLYSGSDPDPYFDINTSISSTASARVLPSGELEFDLVNTSFPLKIYGFSFSDFVHVWKANADNVYEIVYTYNLTASEFFGVAVEFTGYANDYNSGYKEGYSVGSSTGYNRGYSEGVKAAGDYTFLSLLGAVVDAPLQAVGGMLNFNLLGFNMLNFFYALLTCALVIAVIRLIL